MDSMRLTSCQVAELLGITESALRMRRSDGRPCPPWHRESDGTVYYLPEEVDAWLKARDEYLANVPRREKRA